MVAMGTGLAPMGGFIQQRACLAAANTDINSANGSDSDRGKGNVLGCALLCFGCRDYESGLIYAAELWELENLGVVDVRSEFSRRGPPLNTTTTLTKTGEKKACLYYYHYMHERMWEELGDLFKRGAKIFVWLASSRRARTRLSSEFGGRRFLVRLMRMRRLG